MRMPLWTVLLPIVRHRDYFLPPEDAADALIFAAFPFLAVVP